MRIKILGSAAGGGFPQWNCACPQCRLVREFHSFRVYATASVRKVLTEDNSLFRVLARFAGQVSWDDIPLEHPFFAAGARLEALPLAGSLPGFVSSARLPELNPAEAVI